MAQQQSITKITVRRPDGVEDALERLWNQWRHIMAAQNGDQS